MAALVLAAHAWFLLGGAAPSPGPERRANGARPLQVRQIVMAPVVSPGAPMAAAAEAAAARPERTRPRSRVTSPRAHRAVARSPGSASAPSAPADAVAPIAAPVPDAPMPTYATRLPPAATLRYALRRGAALGHAELSWRPADGRYLLVLDTSGAARQGTSSVSQGGLDDTGVVPERYTEGRRGREARAVNFRRELGLITFSGPSSHHPLLPGAQDRLSWMVQLAAILDAGPDLREPGREVLMFVAGTRGDGEVWVFTVQGSETLDTPGGAVDDALHLRRQARRPYDTQVEVWLDPARHHLPVRLQLLVPSAGGGAEFLLERHSDP